MPKKVFELAKELEIGPLDLVEALKAKGFHVRNHMAELSDDDVANFLSTLKKEKAEHASKDEVKKKIVKKKIPTSEVKAVEKKGIEKKIIDKKSAEKKSDAVEPIAKEVKTKELTKDALAHKKKATVIRRKSDDKDSAHEYEQEDVQTVFSSTLNEDEEVSSEEVFFEEEISSEEEIAYDENELVAEEQLADSVEDEEQIQEQDHEPDGEMKDLPAESHVVIESSGIQTTTKITASGLRVVSRAPVRVPEVPLEVSEVKKEVLPTTKPTVKPEEKRFSADRPHRFTPVYIPSQDPLFREAQEAKAKLAEAAKAKQLQDAKAKQAQDAKAKEDAARKPQVGVAKVGSLQEEEEKKRGEEEENKKRMGGLASMMTGKKAVASKAQTLTMSRAEEELRSYTTLSGTGRPIYTQIMRKRDYLGPTQQTERTEVKESKRVVIIHKGSELGELAKKLSLKFKDLVDECLKLNLLIKETDYVGPTLAAEICALFGYRVEDKAFNEEKIIGKATITDDEKSKFPVRPPVVAIMGHVDHGKTTLLDSIRKAKVASGEAGGITQHIGAYSVSVNGGKHITFLDTPGHAAFAAMRQRGAHATDIVVLVVAADDGVMPQTKESIKYCETAGVPIIIAVNKMDKPGVNPDNVKRELTEFNLMPEDWGGQTQYVHVSALKGTGIDELLEGILLQAEMLDLRANPKAAVEGVVIESKIEPGRGPIATLLIQNGTLNKGDYLVVGETFGRARSLTDHLGVQLESAGPSTPIQILGLEGTPAPGDRLNIVKNEREAKKIAENRIQERKLLAAAPEKKKVSLEDFFANAAKEGEEQKFLNLIIRSDVQGSFEAIKSALETLGNSEVAVKVVAGGVGPITDSDVQMGATSGGFVIGFNMRPVTSARKLAEDKGVDIKNYSVIYELINDVKLALEGLLDPEFVEEFIGRAEVREVFNIPKAGVIAGSYVIDGKIAQGCNIRLLRNGKIMHDGKLSSLKRFKDDVKEVKNGYECGISLESYSDIKQGDIFEAYLMIQKKRTLEDNIGMTQSGSKETRPTL